MERARDKGNLCVKEGDYAGALVAYTLALRAAAAPPDDKAALHSNRSLAFLKLGCHGRALAEADCAIRARPKWPKAYFRKAEALATASLHNDALAAYRTAAQLDPTDEHIRARLAVAIAAGAAQTRREALTVGASVAAGIFLLLMLVTSSKTSSRATGMAAILNGAVLGVIVGVGIVALLRLGRSGSVQPDGMGNDEFIATRITGGAELPRGKEDVEGKPAPTPGKRAHRAVRNGRAAALRAMGKS